MASPFPSLNDPALIDLLKQYQLPDEERKRLLLGNMLLGIGGGLMGGKRGNEIGALGSGAVVGAQMGQQAISDAQRSKMDQLKANMSLQDYMDKRSKDASRQQSNKDIAALFQPQNPTAGMPDRSPTVENAANIPAPPAKWQLYEQAAQKAAQAGDMEQAKMYAGFAEKFRPQIKDQKVLTQNGKRVVVNIYNDGTTQVIPDLGPDAEKLQFANTGGMAGVGLDPYSGAQVSQGLPVTMDPAQADASKRGWAGLSQSERHFQATQGKEKAPQWDSTSGQFVYPPTKENPTGAAVAPKGYTPKQERPSDQQLATGGFLDRMQFASKYIDALEKKGYEPGVGQAAVNATKGIPLVGGVLGYAAESGQNWAAPQSAAYNNAQEAWIRAKLRKESGAVIGVDEMEGERRTFFPQPNDPQEVRQQKAALRKQVEHSMVKQARGGFQGGAGQDDPLGLR